MMSKELEKHINTLVNCTVATVMDNAIGTFRGIKDLPSRELIANKFIDEVYMKCLGYKDEYFNNQKQNKND